MMMRQIATFAGIIVSVALITGHGTGRLTFNYIVMWFFAFRIALFRS